MRRGFTLIEMMFAVAIFSLIVGAFGTAFVGIHRLIDRSYTEAELSVRTRLLRERLLFHVTPMLGGATYVGAFSGVSDFRSDDELVAHATVDDTPLKAGNNLYFVNLNLSTRGITSTERIRTERVVVPVFGSEQKKDLTSVFHDD